MNGAGGLPESWSGGTWEKLSASYTLWSPGQQQVEGHPGSLPANSIF